jgi:hypothetical protein
MMRRYLPKSTEELLRFYERYVSPISLVAGFVADNLILLRRVDLWTTNALFTFYLSIAAFGIVFLNLAETGRIRSRALQNITPFVPIVMQFSFGGLFSGYLSLYSRSASFAVSWVFVIAIAALLLGNERFTRLYVRFTFQVSLLFFVLFSFLIFFLPVVLSQIGPAMFLFSGAVSLAGIALFLLLLRALVPEIVRRQFKTVAISILAIYAVFNMLYFSNAIPPLPLSLKEAGVYHSVIHPTAGGYAVSTEPEPWYQQYLNFNLSYHRAPGEPVYVWTSVFAPSGLTTTILHEWQHYDATTRSWKTVAAVPFVIYGGRDGGYGGYSEIPNPQEGGWRVNVITQYGQLIGQVYFTVENVASPVPLISTTV